MQNSATKPAKNKAPWECSFLSSSNFSAKGSEFRLAAMNANSPAAEMPDRSDITANSVPASSGVI
jgi:hypothetical protein